MPLLDAFFFFFLLRFIFCLQVQLVALVNSPYKFKFFNGYGVIGAIGDPFAPFLRNSNCSVPHFQGRGLAKNGYLTKQGGVRQNWKRRWMAMDPQQKTMSYYENEDEKKVLGVIDLEM